MDYRTRIKNIREDRDVTQKQIGKILNKSQQGYSHIESGRAELKIDDLKKLCEFYGLSADYLIGVTDDEKTINYKSPFKRLLLVVPKTAEEIFALLRRDMRIRVHFRRMTHAHTVRRSFAKFVRYVDKYSNIEYNCLKKRKEEEKNGIL